MGRECEKCGVIFSRYKKIQEKKQEAAAAAEAKREKQSGRIKSLVQSLVLVVAAIAGTVYYMNQNTRDQEVVQPPVVAQSPTEAPSVSTPARQSEPVTAPIQTSSQAKKPNGPMTIEEARQATVSIETPWGSGSGFFVSDNFIVTNRHVVQMEESVLVEYRRKVDMTRELVELEKKKLRDLRARLRQTDHGPTRRQIKIIIEESERNLNIVLPQLEDAERQLVKLMAKPRPDDIKIILADGSGHYANFLLVSQSHDLALMSIYINDVSYLRPPPAGGNLQQGDKVFTIGSPVGLRNTVTSGVFSGYRRDPKDDSLFLQTDAPINPGNSGGPLIDEMGYVHGVNTMILQNTEGIGFAIPIRTVFEEFGSSIY